MSPFRHVEGEAAGPAALGILVPPGRRTLVIVRPRALEWDLIPLDPGDEGESGERFWEMGREFAPRLAREIAAALEEGTSGRVEPVASPDGGGYQLRAGVGRFVLLACHRRAGQAYEPLRFATVAEACAAAEQVAAVLCPAAEAGQELYFNTRYFAR
jgi:hypothetical protein